MTCFRDDDGMAVLVAGFSGLGFAVRSLDPRFRGTCKSLSHSSPETIGSSRSYRDKIGRLKMSDKGQLSDIFGSVQEAC